MGTFDLDTTLLELHGERQDGIWTVRDAVEGVQIFGGIGSGKTSGSGRMIALKFLKAGFGGLVLTVKPDEREEWEIYAQLTGRTDDLIIVSPDHDNYFNFLEYESKDGNTENIVQVLKTVIRAGEQQSKGIGGDDPFWETALDMLIFNVIDLCQLAYGKVSVQAMYDIVQSLPRAENAGNDENSAFWLAYTQARKNVEARAEAWRNGKTLDEREQLMNAPNYETLLCDAVPRARTLRFIDQFFGETLLNLAEKTRSIIDFSFSGFLFRLLRDPVYRLFCNTSSTFNPEDCLNGKIIVLDLPVKMHHKIGRDAQIMFKYVWQRAMERRNINTDGGLPLFLWADEAQNFLHEHDAEYQATARSSRIATIYITQNLPNYHASMGGAKSEFRVKGFLGTLATKIFHANADVETNRYASELIGDGYYEDTSKSTTMAGEFSSSRNRSLKIDKIVRPEAFPQLKTGGIRNGHKVEAYMHFQGNPLGHVKITFNQKYETN